MQITQILKVEVTDEHIKDMYQTACEGGVNYWCEAARIEDDGSGGIKGFAFLDAVEERWVSTNLETFARAMVERATERGLSYAEFMDGEYDAIDVDVIVQRALFDKVIYG